MRELFRLGGKTVTGWRLAAVLVGVLVFTPQPALAEDYPAPSPVLDTSTGTVRPGGTVTISGVLGPFDHVTIDVDWGDGSSGGAALTPAATTGRAVFTPAIDSGGASIAPAIENGGGAVITPVVIIGETDADSIGRFSVTLELSKVGMATVVATGSPSGRTATTVLKVLAALPASSGTDTSNTIPVTGQRTGTLVALGAGSFVLGALMVLAAVTRRRRATASVPAE